MPYHVDLLDDAFVSETKYAKDGARHTYLSLLEEHLDKREAEGYTYVGMTPKTTFGDNDRYEVDAMLVFRKPETDENGEFKVIV